VVDVAGVKIGLFGLVRALPEDADRWKAWRLDARDPVAAARDEVVALHARGARIVIALVHAGPYEEAKKILQAAPGIDWAVLGHSALNLETPDDVGDARVVEAMSMGKDFGRLDLHFVGESGDGGANGTLRFVDRGRRAQLLAILRDH
jgi:2',3'-cyclic-nucleotide 2'-phosphodiesterase (5'-nucleotidase family)